jgi:hypothetical protein
MDWQRGSVRAGTDQAIRILHHDSAPLSSKFKSPLGLALNLWSGALFLVPSMGSSAGLLPSLHLAPSRDVEMRSSGYNFPRGTIMDNVSYPDSKTVRDVVKFDAVHPLVLEADEWDALATALPTVIPELAKLFSAPSIFGE